MSFSSKFNFGEANRPIYSNITFIYMDLFPYNDYYDTFSFMM